MASAGLSPDFPEWLALTLTRGRDVKQLLKRLKSFLVKGSDWWLKGLLEKRDLQGAEDVRSPGLCPRLVRWLCESTVPQETTGGVPCYFRHVS